MICSVGAENTGCKCWSFSSFLVFHYIAMCLTVNEKNPAENIWWLLPSEYSTEVKLSTRGKCGQWYFPHEIIFIWGMSVKKLLCVSVQNLIILSEKKCNSKYEVVEYVMSFLSSNYGTAHKVITIFWTLQNFLSWVLSQGNVHSENGFL